VDVERCSSETRCSLGPAAVGVEDLVECLLALDLEVLCWPLYPKLSSEWSEPCMRDSRHAAVSITFSGADPILDLGRFPFQEGGELNTSSCEELSSAIIRAFTSEVFLLWAVCPLYCSLGKPCALCESSISPSLGSWEAH